MDLNKRASYRGALPKRAREIVISVGEYFAKEVNILFCGRRTYDQMLTAAVQGKTKEGRGPVPFSPKLFHQLTVYLILNTTDIHDKIESITGIDKNTVIHIKCENRKTRGCVSNAVPAKKVKTIIDDQLEVTIKVENADEIDELSNEQ